MMMIVEKENVSLLINRNPTLNYYSMLLLKVRKVKRSGTDYCLSVPLSINLVVMSTLNYPKCGELLLSVIYQLLLATVLGQRVTPAIW